jgi:hypothetical protein
MEEGKMKKLVLFTLVLVVCLSGSAFALLNDNNVAVATDDAPAVAIDAQKAATAAFGAQSATTGGENEYTDVDVTKTKTDVDVKVEDSLNNNKVALDNGKIAGRDVNPDNRSNYDNNYIVDNAILANVNVAREFEDDISNRISFSKSQHAEMEGSFNHATGVSNVNSAAGNMNSQTAYTAISIGSIGDGGRR